MPAKAGIQKYLLKGWVPASAGTTVEPGRRHICVMPAKAGIQKYLLKGWVPAFAGTTVEPRRRWTFGVRDSIDGHATPSRTAAPR